MICMICHVLIISMKKKKCLKVLSAAVMIGSLRGIFFFFFFFFFFASITHISSLALKVLITAAVDIFFLFFRENKD